MRYSKMKKGPPIDPSVDKLRTPEAAKYTGISASTLAKSRMRDSETEGPPWVNLSRSVIYLRSDLDEWIEKNKVRK